jgi:hypothetical protein
MRAAREVLQSIDSATSLEERLKWIADGPSHREQVDKFFKGHPTGLQVAGMESNVGFYTELPSGDDVKLLLASTASCPSGAMVRLRPRAGKSLLDWPLFEQTHQLEFDEFVSRADAPSRRFTVICARSRANDLPDTEKEKYVAIRAQGSLSLHGEALLYYVKGTPSGNFLDSRIVWGRGYLVDVKVEHADIAGKQVLLVKDCAGASAPAP